MRTRSNADGDDAEDESELAAAAAAGGAGAEEEEEEEEDEDLAKKQHLEDDTDDDDGTAAMCDGRRSIHIMWPWMAHQEKVRLEKECRIPWSASFVPFRFISCSMYSFKRRGGRRKNQQQSYDSRQCQCAISVRREWCSMVDLYSRRRRRRRRRRHHHHHHHYRSYLL